MNPLPTILALALLLPPLVTGAPNAQTGQQDGGGWGPATAVAVQPGTNFTLVGIVGDHDIFFYDASGALVGQSIRCAHDQGIVPHDAAVGIVRQWDMAGELTPCVLSQPGPSQFVYVDGL